MASTKKWSLVFSEKADRQFHKLDKTIQTHILHYLEKIIRLPHPRIQGTPLKGSLRQYWRYRVGDYRVMCQIKDELITISVVKVAHRREVYSTTLH